jgi:hypothetical protein
MVLPAPANIEASQKNLDYALYPDNSQDKVQLLHESIQSISYRLQALEICYDQIARHSSELPESLIPLRKQVRETTQRVFERWAKLEQGDAFEEQSALRMSVEPA